MGPVRLAVLDLAVTRVNYKPWTTLPPPIPLPFLPSCIPRCPWRTCDYSYMERNILKPAKTLGSELTFLSNPSEHGDCSELWGPLGFTKGSMLERGQGCGCSWKPIPFLPSDNSWAADVASPLGGISWAAQRGSRDISREQLREQHICH